MASDENRTPWLPVQPEEVPGEGVSTPSADAPSAGMDTGAPHDAAPESIFGAPAPSMRERAPEWPTPAPASNEVPAAPVRSPYLNAERPRPQYASFDASPPPAEAPAPEPEPAVATEDFPVVDVVAAPAPEPTPEPTPTPDAAPAPSAGDAWMLDRRAAPPVTGPIPSLRATYVEPEPTQDAPTPYAPANDVPVVPVAPWTSSIPIVEPVTAEETPFPASYAPPAAPTYGEPNYGAPATPEYGEASYDAPVTPAYGEPATPFVDEQAADEHVAYEPVADEPVADEPVTPEPEAAPVVTAEMPAYQPSPAAAFFTRSAPPVAAPAAEPSAPEASAPEASTPEASAYEPPLAEPFDTDPPAAAVPTPIEADEAEIIAPVTPPVATEIQPTLAHDVDAAPVGATPSSAAAFDAAAFDAAPSSAGPGNYASFAPPEPSEVPSQSEYSPVAEDPVRQLGAAALSAASLEAAGAPTPRLGVPMVQQGEASNVPSFGDEPPFVPRFEAMGGVVPSATPSLSFTTPTPRPLSPLSDLELPLSDEPDYEPIVDLAESRELTAVHGHTPDPAEDEAPVAAQRPWSNLDPDDVEFALDTPAESAFGAQFSGEDEVDAASAPAPDPSPWSAEPFEPVDVTDHVEPESEPHPEPAPEAPVRPSAAVPPWELIMGKPVGPPPVPVATPEPELSPAPVLEPEPFLEPALDFPFEPEPVLEPEPELAPEPSEPTFAAHPFGAAVSPTAVSPTEVSQTAAFDAAVFGAPTPEVPSYVAPTYAAPTYAAPTYAAPTYAAPATAAPFSSPTPAVSPTLPAAAAAAPDQAPRTTEVTDSPTSTGDTPTMSRKGRTISLIVAGVVAASVIGYVVYRLFFMPEATVLPTPTIIAPAPSASAEPIELTDPTPFLDALPRVVGTDVLVEYSSTDTVGDTALPARAAEHDTLSYGPEVGTVTYTVDAYQHYTVEDAETAYAAYSEGFTDVADVVVAGTVAGERASSTTGSEGTVVWRNGTAVFVLTGPADGVLAFFEQYGV